MNMAASNPPSMPSTMLYSFGPPLMSSAASCSSSAIRFRMSQWLSLTHTDVAPAARAPSMAALASPVMSRHERAYSAACRGSVGSVWSSWATPATPSMSTEMYTRMPSPSCEGFATMVGCRANFKGYTMRGIRAVTVLALLSACGGTSKPDPMLEQGRQYTDWLLKGRFEPLYANFSAEMRKTFPSVAELSSFVSKTTAELGSQRGQPVER